MRKIIRYVFITLMLVCGLILALPFAGFRKNLDTELSKPIAKITQDSKDNNKKNIQLFNVLGIALNDPSNQMVMIAENKSDEGPNKNSEKLVYISYVVKSDKTSNTSGSTSISDISKQNSLTVGPGYSPLLATSKSANSENGNQLTSTTDDGKANSTKAITKQSGNGPGGDNDNDPPPLGSLPLGDENYFIAFLIAVATLYKYKKTIIA